MLSWKNNSQEINTTNSAAELPSEYCRRFQDEKFLMLNYTVTLMGIILFMLSCPVIILMNLLVIVAVKTKRRIQSIYNILLACLAGTDFVLGTVTLPVFAAVEIFALSGHSVDAYCKRFKETILLVNFPILSSLYHLVLISVERYIAMKYALRYHEIVTKRRLAIAVAVIWLFALSYTIYYNLSPNSSFPRFVVSVLILCSTMIIAYCHVAVYLVTRRHKKQISTEQISREAAAKFLKETKAWKTTGIIIGVVFFSYLPATVFLLRRMSASYVQVVMAFQPIAFFIMMAGNSLCNPMIYCWRCTSIREAIISLIKRQHRNEIT